MLVWFAANVGAFVLAWWSYASGDSPDERIGAAIPLVAGFGSSVVWFVVLVAWLVWKA